ncbi:MAG: hypothetical protein IJT66_06510 [Clostridia bacterium]|nr:hypothetical protein [Clostridia bacterium]
MLMNLPGAFQEIFSDADIPSELVALGGVIALSASISCLVALVLYLLRAFGVYKMAKTAGVNLPGLAFVPIINNWTFGAVAQKYVKRDGSRSAKFSVILLVLRIASMVLSVALCAAAVVAIVRFIAFVTPTVGGTVPVPGEIPVPPADAFTVFIPTVFLSFLTSAVGLAFSITHYVALWRICNAFDYGNGTLFTVLSVFFNFLEPIFLFLLRNKQPNFDYRAQMNQFYQTENFPQNPGNPS